MNPIYHEKWVNCTHLNNKCNRVLCTHFFKIQILYIPYYGINRVVCVASIILLCHNLAPKDAMPVNYFIQYAGLILETIHIKLD